MVKKILLKVRPDLINSEYTKKIIKAIETKNFDLYLDKENIPKDNSKNYKSMRLSEANSDLVIIVGGDGTLLYTIINLPQKCPPILGVDMGTIAFLTEINPDQIEWALDKIIKNEYQIIKKDRLRININGQDFPDSLNEILITTEPGKTIKTDIFIGDEYVNQAVGDGIIISTPTGSTAYSRSAGGSIIDKELKAYTIVPVCAFKTTFCPIVIPYNKKVKINFLNEQKPHIIIIDGQHKFEVKNQKSVTVEISARPVPFIKFKNNFYERVRKNILSEI